MSQKRKSKKNIPRKSSQKPHKLFTFFSTIKNSKYALPVAIAVISLFFLIQFLAFVPSYQTNDDIGMSFFASGRGTNPKPDEHLRYTHVIPGLILKTMYTHFPGFPWYGFYHFLVHFLSMTALLYAVLYSSFTWTRLSFFLIFLAAVELYFLNNLQFTVTSFVAGQSGIFLFLAFIKDKSAKSWLMLTVSVLLLILSFFVRSSVFYLVMLLAIPLLGTVFLESYKNRGVVVKYSVFIIILVLSTSLLNIYNKAYYNRDPEWKDFFAVNALKSRFIDWRHTAYNDETKYIFDEVNWSRNDYYILLTWFFADESLYSKENLEKVSSIFPAYKTYMSPGDVLQQFRTIISKMFFLLLIALLFSFYVSADNRSRATILSTLLLIFMVMIFLIVTKRLPLRVYHPMFSFLIVTCLYLTDKGIDFSLTGLGKIKIILLLIIVTGLIPVFQKHLITGRKNIYNNRQFKKTISEIKPREDQLFVVWGATLPYEHILPFDTMEFMKNFKLISLGTTLRTPVTKARMKEFSITDIYKALYEKDNVFLIVNNMRYLYYYTQYVLEHFDVNVQFRYVFRSSVFSIIKVYDETNPEFLENVQQRKIVFPYR